MTPQRTKLIQLADAAIQKLDASHLFEYCSVFTHQLDNSDEIMGKPPKPSIRCLVGEDMCLDCPFWENFEKPEYKKAAKVTKNIGRVIVKRHPTPYPNPVCSPTGIWTQISRPSINFYRSNCLACRKKSAINKELDAKTLDLIIQFKVFVESDP